MTTAAAPLRDGRSQRRPRRLVRWGAGALVMIGIIAALQLRPRPVAANGGPQAERRRALDAATALLWPSHDSAGYPAAGTATAGGAEPAPAGAPSEAAQAAPAAATVAAAGAPSPGARAVPPADSAPERAPSPVRPHPDTAPPPARPTPTGAARPDGMGRRAPAPPGPVAARRRIPDAIEGGTLTAPGGDGLQSLAIEGRLRVLSGAKAPFRLLATRVGSGTARAQLAPRGATGDATASWFEPGDSPAPGWRVLAIAGPDALLLTPGGSLLRLRLAAPASDAAADNPSAER